MDFLLFTFLGVCFFVVAFAIALDIACERSDDPVARRQRRMRASRKMNRL